MLLDFFYIHHWGVCVLWACRYWTLLFFLFRLGSLHFLTGGESLFKFWQKACFITLGYSYLSLVTLTIVPYVSALGTALFNFEKVKATILVLAIFMVWDRSFVAEFRASVSIIFLSHLWFGVIELTLWIFLFMACWSLAIRIILLSKIAFLFVSFFD